jgi:hypothetical protein
MDNAKYIAECSPPDFGREYTEPRILCQIIRGKMTNR